MVVPGQPVVKIFDLLVAVCVSIHTGKDGIHPAAMTVEVGNCGLYGIYIPEIYAADIKIVTFQHKIQALGKGDGTSGVVTVADGVQHPALAGKPEYLPMIPVKGTVGGDDMGKSLLLIGGHSGKHRVPGILCVCIGISGIIKFPRTIDLGHQIHILTAAEPLGSGGIDQQAVGGVHIAVFLQPLVEGKAVGSIRKVHPVDPLFVIAVFQLGVAVCVQTQKSQLLGTGFDGWQLHCLHHHSKWFVFRCADMDATHDHHAAEHKAQQPFPKIHIFHFLSIGFRAGEHTTIIDRPCRFVKAALSH